MDQKMFVIRRLLLGLVCYSKGLNDNLCIPSTVYRFGEIVGNLQYIYWTIRLTWRNVGPI